MKSLIFDQLLVRSNSQRLANQFKFSKTLNLITGKDNSVGKSTLIKLLYWTFGCEVFFDSTWSSFDCESLVRFHFGDDHFIISRYKNLVYFKKVHGKSKVFKKITGDFSELLAAVLNFNLLLPNRDSGKLEVPPPAFFFLPYYIDQKRSWAKALDNFDSLGQYSSWQRNTLKYHVGLIGKDFFEFERDIVADKEKMGEHSEKIVVYEAAVQVVEEIIPRTETILDEKKLSEAIDDLKQRVKILTIEQESLFSEISESTDELTFLEQQKTLSQRLIHEINKDYEFSVENIPNNWIECPLCGVRHDNSITSRASLLADQSQLQEQMQTIEQKIEKVRKKLDALKIRNNNLKEVVHNLNAKYQKELDGLTPDECVARIASNEVQSKVQERISVENAQVASIKSEIKNKKRDQKRLVSPEEEESIYSVFLNYLIHYLEKLDARGINLSQVKTPLDYNVMQKEGGAAEGSRAMLAYYFAIYSSIKEKQNSSVAPFSVDTPNQQEQSHINYSKIVDLILNDISSPNCQVFLCAMENKDLEPIVSKSKVITLTEEKILLKSMFDGVSDEFVRDEISYKMQQET